MINHSAAKLKAWRSSQDLTQAQAGRRFGVTRMTWFRWENGEVAPRAAMISKLCSAIADLQPNDFYNLSGLTTVRRAA
jgi:transcriptional regulator with XRE-family HTH domain